MFNIDADMPLILKVPCLIVLSGRVSLNVTSNGDVPVKVTTIDVVEPKHTVCAKGAKVAVGSGLTTTVAVPEVLVPVHPLASTTLVMVYVYVPGAAGVTTCLLVGPPAVLNTWL